MWGPFYCLLIHIAWLYAWFAAHKVLAMAEAAEATNQKWVSTKYTYGVFWAYRSGLQDSGTEPTQTFSLATHLQRKFKFFLSGDLNFNTPPE